MITWIIVGLIGFALILYAVYLDWLIEPLNVDDNGDDYGPDEPALHPDGYPVDEMGG